MYTVLGYRAQGCRNYTVLVYKYMVIIGHERPLYASLATKNARGTNPFFGFQKSQQASNVKLIQMIESESSCQAAGRIFIGFVIRPCNILIGGG